MIALCLRHHIEADHETYTIEQLRALKHEPFLRQEGAAVLGRFNWTHEQFVLTAGGGFYIRCPIFLEIGGRPVVWLSTDGVGHKKLNLDIWDSDGQIAFSMRDNDWVALGDLNDVESPPSAGSVVLKAPERDVHLAIEFARAGPERLREEVRKHQEKARTESARAQREMVERLATSGAPESMFGAIGEPPDNTEEIVRIIYRGVPEGEVVICALRAHLPFPIPIDINSRRLLLPRNNQLIGGVISDCRTAISVR